MLVTTYDERRPGCVIRNAVENQSFGLLWVAKHFLWKTSVRKWEEGNPLPQVCTFVLWGLTSINGGLKDGSCERMTSVRLAPHLDADFKKGLLCSWSFSGKNEDMFPHGSLLSQKTVQTMLNNKSLVKKTWVEGPWWTKAVSRVDVRRYELHVAATA